MAAETVIRTGVDFVCLMSGQDKVDRSGAGSGSAPPEANRGKPPPDGGGLMNNEEFRERIAAPACGAAHNEHYASPKRGGQKETISGSGLAAAVMEVT